MKIKRFIIALAVFSLASLAGDRAYVKATGVLTPPSPVVSAPPSTPLVPVNPDDWESMAAAVRSRARRFHGDVGYVIKDFRSGRTIQSNADHVFLSASLIKLPILVAAFQAIHDGRLTLTEKVRLTRKDRQGGSGILKFSAPGTVFAMSDLLEDMIIYSDNTATRLVVRRMGVDYLQQTFVRLGLKDTQIHSQGFRLTPRYIAEDNLTSPRDAASLLNRMYARTLVSPEASEQMLTILKHQKLRDRLPRYLPMGWEIAHKTGLLRRSCHDVGIVFTPKGDYMICVLTGRDMNYRSAKHFIASLGRLTFDYYLGNGFHRPVLQTRRITRDLHPAG